MVLFSGPIIRNLTTDRGDDELLTFGDDDDIAVVLRSTALSADTALTNVLVTDGSIQTPALTANSLIISNVTENGEILFAARRGANSIGLLELSGQYGRTFFYSYDGPEKMRVSTAGITINVPQDSAGDFVITGQTTDEWCKFDVSAQEIVFAAATEINTTTGALTLDPGGSGSGSLLFTGTLALTGSRVTQSYHTNITSTNALTVDSWSASKENIVQYSKSALDILQGVEVISFSHLLDRDPSGRTKLGVRAESIQEPLALVNMDYGHNLGAGPALDTMGLMALAVKAIQELQAEVRELKEA